MSADADLQHFGDPSEPGAPGHQAWLAEQRVLPGFEEEVGREEREKLQRNAKRALAAATPTVEKWTGRDGTPRYTLYRSQAWESEDGHRTKAVTAILSEAEWNAIRTAVLAEHGLTTIEKD
jgi:hypothetical protein